MGPRRRKENTKKQQEQKIISEFSNAVTKGAPNIISTGATTATFQPPPHQISRAESASQQRTLRHNSACHTLPKAAPCSEGRQDIPQNPFRDPHVPAHLHCSGSTVSCVKMRPPRDHGQHNGSFLQCMHIPLSVFLRVLFSKHALPRTFSINAERQPPRSGAMPP